ncbi:MAG: aconitase/3-isopropylmalate dehydratase large subunit family protein [Armatimonadota bacterium]|nr:aconitase/3-isopropylmalate dehydratase large subunit family protein [Armatimonadota bacterium]MDR7452132.1 aconitase/3-isopropylmalate dehydratase large subunit family protein [Armatimonadota bacterium]MDR7467856.1 aconitase/3-isopropylmalate dehydratase large subunit family protein [Armatimonadota bacterium]MDR7494744.1 aconitase/3-isopropylmalate dehydratase large subunit family protein [Armatimonadota bacterium]MDR7499569.1 aconitase/3-isopropylmalate dehydratase large subunit family pro
MAAGAMTLTEKIIARAAGRDRVRPGEEVWATVDLAAMHDSSGPRRIGETLARLGGRLWDPQKIVLAIDHFVPAANPRQAEIVTATRRWAREHRLPHFFDSVGVMHNLLLEQGLVGPGMLVVGADSHTVTAGAAGALAVGVGATELATVLVTGQIWLRVPPTVRIRFEGPLPGYLTGRDMAMEVLRRLGADFAIYKAVEFDGPAVEGLDLDERAVLANQAIEMGAKNGIVPPRGVILEQLESAARAQGRPVAGDEDAVPEREYRIAMTDSPPLVAVPPNVDRIVPAGDLGGIELDRVYIGSCVGGKAADLRAAARVLQGRKARIPLQIAPATLRVVRETLQDGTLQTLLEAGAILQAPGCGACAGLHSGLLGPRERCLSTVTRNFPGRMGDRSAEIYLASPLTAAASAATGRITDPRELL